ncbi:MAG: hypothetical protein P8L85_08955 [Rubripirellula sp.]|nr:hypothetical protein [Rubripirellula sp.]
MDDPNNPHQRYAVGTARHPTWHRREVGLALVPISPATALVFTSPPPLACNPMNVRQFVLLAASFALLGPVSAQEPLADVNEPAAAPAETVSIFQNADPAIASSPSQNRPSRMSVAELRQQRGMFRANQRMARIEYNLWMGREPLRPKFNSVPMMSSRYAPRRIYVPVYVQSR